jgi:transposase
MIVLGADTHKRSHTIAAVAATTGELLGEQTVAVGRRGFDALLRCARDLDGERVWALEDCRHVSGSLERFLIQRGERVLRIPTHLAANARKSARQRGKSDPIDALNVARAALQKALRPSRPRTWTGPSSTCGCSSTIANGLSATASSSTARCSGICTICGPSSG